MDESGWSGLPGNYSADNANLQGQQDMSNVLAGSGMGFSQPPIQTPSYGGSVQPSSFNGYPVFSSSQAGASAPAGYANANPVDATPSMVMPQARMGTQAPQQANPQAPVPPAMNPWNIKTSSPSGAFDYPLGQNVPPAKLNVS